MNRMTSVGERNRYDFLVRATVVLWLLLFVAVTVICVIDAWYFSFIGSVVAKGLQP